MIHLSIDFSRMMEPFSLERMPEEERKDCNHRENECF
jgi:hypothetical protein